MCTAVIDRGGGWSTRVEHSSTKYYRQQIKKLLNKRLRHYLKIVYLKLGRSFDVLCVIRLWIIRGVIRGVRGALKIGKLPTKVALVRYKMIQTRATTTSNMNMKPIALN